MKENTKKSNQSEHQEAYEALRESEEQLRLILEASRDVLVQFNLQTGRYEYVSPSVKFLVGYSPEEFIGMDRQTALTMVHPDDLPVFQAAQSQSLETGQAEAEYRQRHKNGDWVWVSNLMSVAKDSAGRPLYRNGCIRDVTERKRTDQALRDNEQRWSTTLSSIGDAVIATDTSGRITYMNAIAENTTGWRLEEVAGRQLTEVFQIINEQSRQRATNPVEKVLQSGVIVGLANHTVLIRKDGTVIPIDDSGAPIRGSDGQTTGVVLVFKDITGRKKAEEALSQAHRKLQNVLGSITDGLLVLDKDWRYTYFNEQGARTIGMRPEDLIGGCVWELFPHAKGTNFYEGYHRAVETGQPVQFVEYYPEPLNKWLECHCYPSEEGLSVYFQDITARKKAEEALSASEKRLRRIYESGILGIIYWNINGEITDANDKFLEMMGYTREDLQAGRIDWTNMTPPEYRYLDERSIEELKITGVNYTPFEKEYIRKDGTRVPIILSGAMLDEKRFNGVAFVLDITARKKAEEALKESEAKANALIKYAPTAIYEIDYRGPRLLSVNDAMCAMSGYSREELLSMNLMELLTAESKMLFSQRTKCQLAGEQIDDTVDFQVRKKDGSIIFITLNVSFSREKPHTALVIGHNITERKQAEEALQIYSRELEAANKELEAFNYSVSHDLKQPLRALESFSDLLLTDYNDKLDDTGKDYLNRVRKASQFISELTDDMLKLSRATREDMYRDNIDLSEVARSIIGELKATNPERHVEAVIAPYLVVQGDRALMTIALRNLLENSWKFTGKCTHTRIEIGKTKNDGVETYFIRDNGVGFDMRYQDKLFKPFHRLHTGKDFPGTGIGLAIVQRIIRRHGGVIRAESDLDKGTTFYFTMG